MRFRFFTLPAFDPDAAQDALNAFCAQHRIVASDRHFVDRGVDSFWAVCITWVEGSAAAFPAQGKRERVDYREVLGEADFAAFSELRRLRKHLADREGVPAYAIFTHAHLAARVQRRVATAVARHPSGAHSRGIPRSRPAPVGRHVPVGVRRVPAHALATPLLTRRSSRPRRPHGPWQKPQATRRVRWACSRTAESPPGRCCREAA